jgi:hypothetical protein
MFRVGGSGACKASIPIDPSVMTKSKMPGVVGVLFVGIFNMGFCANL